MQIKSVSKKLNADGLAIVERWKTKASENGFSLRQLCELAENRIFSDGKRHGLSVGKLAQQVNMWRYAPPVALLLVNEIYNLIGFEATKKTVEGFAPNRGNTAVDYFIAIEEVLQKRPL